MELAADFSFQPLPALENEVQQPFPQVASPLGPLNINRLSWPHITVGTLRKA